MLEGDIQDAYYMQLQKEYIFLKQKFIIDNSGVIPSQFFRLRPPNFPTIRLSQLAKMYNHHSNIFAKIIKTNSIKEFYKLLSIEASVYWKTHYTFGKVSKLSKKKVTKSFIDLLLLNTIIPLKFSFAKFQGKEIDNEIMNLIQSINSEKNSIVDKFNKVKQVSTSALESQALIQLKSNYCDKNKCLQCEIGNLLLNRN